MFTLNYVWLDVATHMLVRPGFFPQAHDLQKQHAFFNEQIDILDSYYNY